MVKPNVIVETGIAHGGSLILIASASMLALLDLCEAITNKIPLDTRAFRPNTERAWLLRTCRCCVSERGRHGVQRQRNRKSRYCPKSALLPAR